MAFPDITLATPYLGQTVYAASDVHIIQKDVDVEGRRLRVFCQLGDNPSFKYWITVQEGAAFDIDWTNADIDAAVRAYFVNPTPVEAPVAPVVEAPVAPVLESPVESPVVDAPVAPVEAPVVEAPVAEAQVAEAPAPVEVPIEATTPVEAPVEPAPAP